MPTVASSALWSRRAIGMLVCGIVAISGSLASGASSSTVVSAQVPSATSVNATACAASTPGVTEFGTILPGSTAVTTADCVITWGSSNDSSMLRAYQSDGRDTGMGAASQIWSLRGTRDQYSHGAVSAATNSIAYLAVGGNGMASTTDGGATWSDQSAASHVFDVSGSPASTNIAAASTSGGQIYRTTNSGATAWTLETSGVTTSLNSVSLADDTNGFAVGVGGVIRRRTTAGGATWAAVTSPVTSTLNGVDAVSATEAFAVGYGDVLLRTGTGGATWSVPASTCFGNYGDVAASDAFTAYAVGLSGVVVKLTWNSGTSVLTCTSLTAAVDIGEDLAGVSVAPGSSTVYVSGALGTVMRSTNGGTTWQRMPTGTSVDLNGISSQPDGSLWAAGSNRTVLRAPTATTFTHRRSGGTDSTSLADIAAVSSTTAYAVGGQVDRGGTWQAAIRRTTDRGATWTSLTSNTSSALLGVSASADGVLVMAVGEDGTIARSTDSGATWTATSWAPGTRLWDIDMFDEYSGWAVGDGGTILRTSNGGTTWTAQSSTITTGLRGVTTLTADLAFAVGTGGRILRTSDAGVTWTLLGGSPTTAPIDDVTSAGGSVWFIHGYQTVQVSTNPTAPTPTWTARTTGSNLDGYAIDAVSARVAYTASAYGGLTRTVDGGATWQTVYPSGGGGEYAYGIDAIDENSAWASGTQNLAYSTESAAAGAIPDYVDGGPNWSSAGSVFGACLRDATGANVVPTWTVDAGCAASGTGVWRGIPTTSANGGAKIAGATAATTATVRLRYGLKVAPSQPPGRYSAGISFDVLAPNA